MIWFSISLKYNQMMISMPQGMDHNLTPPLDKFPIIT